MEWALLCSRRAMSKPGADPGSGGAAGSSHRGVATPTLSVVIIGRNEGERLVRCLESVRRMEGIEGERRNRLRRFGLDGRQPRTRRRPGRPSHRRRIRSADGGPGAKRRVADGLGNVRAVPRRRYDSSSRLCTHRPRRLHRRPDAGRRLGAPARAPSRTLDLQPVSISTGFFRPGSPITAGATCSCGARRSNRSTATIRR